MLQPTEKIYYCIEEKIIAIAGHHVAGSADIDHLRTRNPLAKFRSDRLINNIAVAADPSSLGVRVPRGSA